MSTSDEKAPTDNNDMYFIEQHFQDLLSIAVREPNKWISIVNLFLKLDKRFEICYSNQEYQKIMQHTLKVLKCLIEDPNFNPLSQREKEILLWTGLFHDCMKLAPPDVKTIDGRDPAHPFRSCYMTFIFLNKMKILKNSDEDLKLWETIFEEAYSFDEKANCQVHNMDLVPKIILFIEKLVVSFFSTVLKLICLHQCIHCTTYPPVSPLNLMETSLYFNKNELKLLEIFWYNDAYSYEYIKDTRKEFKFAQEIKENIEITKTHCRSETH